MTENSIEKAANPVIIKMKISSGGANHYVKKKDGTDSGRMEESAGP